MNTTFDPATTPVCQSCGMPLTQEGQLGRHADGTPNPEYCIYCCPEGEEKMTGTLEEMIDFCAEPMGEHTPGLAVEEAKARMRQYFPELKRWKK